MGNEIKKFNGKLKYDNFQIATNAGINFTARAALAATLIEGAFSGLENITKYVSGEKDSYTAIKDTGRDVSCTAVGAALSTAVITTAAAAVPAIATGLTMAAPALTVLTGYYAFNRSCSILKKLF